MLQANFVALCFIEPELLPIEVLHCGNRDFRPCCSCDLDLDSMTFIYELDQYPVKVYYVKIYHITEKQTYATEIIHPSLRGWSDICLLSIGDDH